MSYRSGGDELLIPGCMKTRFRPTQNSGSGSYGCLTQNLKASKLIVNPFYMSEQRNRSIPHSSGGNCSSLRPQHMSYTFLQGLSIPSFMFLRHAAQPSVYCWLQACQGLHSDALPPVPAYSISCILATNKCAWREQAMDVESGTL